MTDIRSHAALSAKLLQAQQTGDLAAQADALLALAELVSSEMWMAYEEQFWGMLPALYMQACAAYQQANDKHGMVNVALAMMNQASPDDAEDRDLDVEPREFMEIYGVALAICVEAGDLWAQARIYSEMSVIAGSQEQQLVLRNKVLQCYETLEALPEQARTLEWLARSYMPNQPEHRLYMKRALTLFTQLNDTKGQARIQQQLDYLEQVHKNRIQNILDRFDKTHVAPPPITGVSRVIQLLSKLLGQNL